MFLAFIANFGSRDHIQGCFINVIKKYIGIEGPILGETYLNKCQMCKDYMNMMRSQQVYERHFSTIIGEFKHEHGNHILSVLIKTEQCSWKNDRQFL